MRDIPELAKATGFWIRDLEVTVGYPGFIDIGYLLSVREPVGGMTASTN